MLQKHKVMNNQFYSDIQNTFFNESVLQITGSFANSKNSQLSMKTISSSATLILLETMLETKKFEMYFTNASYLIGVS